MSSTSSISDLSTASGGGGVGGGGGKMEYHSLDFKIQIDCVKSGQGYYNRDWIKKILIPIPYLVTYL